LHMNEFSLIEALKQQLLPAVSFDRIEHALPVAEALLKGGLKVFEIQCRTAIAAEMITAVRKEFPEMYVGAGTVLNVGQLQKVIDAGAQFGLSPGFNETVCDKAVSAFFPFIPGVMTPSEIEHACERGFLIQKLFPAQQLGGIAFLKALEAPYEQLKVQFIPMGGVNMENLAAYCRLKNVVAVGGSWLATKELMEAKDYRTIEKNVVAALNVLNI
jgi:2-dehydro-3-deoxyphosphogluconate aldolase / (4S)-4-hydroxy-2-oxoglutarate aldolase